MVSNETFVVYIQSIKRKPATSLVSGRDTAIRAGRETGSEIVTGFQLPKVHYEDGELAI